MSKASWEHYSHPADIGIRGFGPTKEQAFAQAALALTAIVAELQTVEPKTQIEISCPPPRLTATGAGAGQDQDDEFLFVDWLNAIIYQMATRQMLFSKFQVSIENNRLAAKAWGEKINVKKHSPAVEVKAATFADLKVKQNINGMWMVQCVVDV